MNNPKLNLREFENPIFSEMSSKEDVSSILGKIRRGDSDSSFVVSSNYTSGAHDCNEISNSLIH